MHYTDITNRCCRRVLFRGYLFKKTIEITSVVKANIFFSILFTAIHVFDEGVLKSPGMIIIFVLVFLLVTYCLQLLLKSKSLFFPIGIHLGNNWATRHLVSIINDGESIFYITNMLSI